MNDEQAAQNTDRELWREREGDYYADSLLVTKEGAIGMNCGGSVFVKPIREWHRLARIDAHCGNCLDPKCPGCEGKRNQGSAPLAQPPRWRTDPNVISRRVAVCVAAEEFHCVSFFDLELLCEAVAVAVSGPLAQPTPEIKT